MADEERPHERELARILVGLTYQTADRLAREKVELLGYLGAVEEWMLGDLGSASGCCASTEHPDDLCAGHEVLRLVQKGLALDTPAAPAHEKEG